MSIYFHLPCTDKETVKRIAIRAAKLYKKYGACVDQQDIEMDLAACHNHGCQLDFERMEGADEFNLMHDVCGINSNLNRETGSLSNCFVPRFAKKLP